MIANTPGILCKLLLLIWLLTGVEPGYAQAITGTTGLVSIPTGEIVPDSSLVVGVSLWNKKYLPYYNNQYHGWSYFFSLGFLPFLEVTLRLTRTLDNSVHNGLGDRSLYVRLRVLREHRYVPALVLGIHDFESAGGSAGTRYFNALYGAVTKTIRPPAVVRKIGVHLGYGFDVIDAKRHHYVGLFGGVSIHPTDCAAVLLEYDAEKINGGIRLSGWRRLHLMLGYLKMTTLTGSLGYRIKL